MHFAETTRLKLLDFELPELDQLPDNVKLNSPSDSAREELLALFRRTLDPQILILACVDDDRFDEDLLVQNFIFLTD